MLYNYVKVALRNGIRHKLFSLIKIVGLAISMTVCLLVIMVIAEQYEYDRFNVEIGRVYRVLSKRPDTHIPYASTPPSLAASLREGYASIEASANLVIGVGGDAVVGEKAVEARGFFGDENFFPVLGFDLRVGDSRTALTQPHSIVITQKLADALFEGGDALGRTINFYDRGLHYLKQGKDRPPVSWGSFTVTGVINAHLHKSHLRFDVLMSQATQRLLTADGKLSDVDSWDNAFTYVMASRRQSREAVDGSLEKLYETRFGSNEKLKGFALSAQPLKEVTPGVLVNQPPSFQLPGMAFYVLGFVALVIMVSACLNYTNLSTARALTRLREIGIRKVSGALRRDLIYQILTESLLTAMLALGLAVLFLFVVQPAFTTLWLNRYLELSPDFNAKVVGYFTAFALLIGIACGSAPALYLSRFKPIDALRSLSAVSRSRLGARKFLNATQFIVSLFFIVTSLLVYTQYRFFMTFKYGFRADDIVNVALQGNAYDRVAQAFQTATGVGGVSGTQYVPATGRTSGMELNHPKGGDPIGFRHLAANEVFVDNLHLKIIAGRNLPPATDSVSRQILLNETGARQLGFKNAHEAVGAVVIQSWNREPLEIVGVVKDFWVKLPIGGDPLDPLFIQNLPHDFSYANVRIQSDHPEEVISKLERIWKQIDPMHPFKYQYYNDELESTHAGIFDVVAIVGFLAFIAITIACLGMLGMAVYTVERRRKEVGIRKVMGAKQGAIVMLLSKEFVWVLGIAVCIGSPLSYFINNTWLQVFPTRAPFGWGILAGSVAILLVLGLFVIVSQSSAAARTNPIDSIREQ